MTETWPAASGERADVRSGGARGSQHRVRRSGVRARLLEGALAALLFATVLGVPNAVAAPADSAEPLVREGIALRSASHDAEALEKFQRAYEIAKTPRIEAQIGMAEQALGRWVDAEAHLAHALAVPVDTWINKNRSTLQTALAAIRSHIGRLEILGKPPGAEIRIEGEVVGRLPLVEPLHLPVGKTNIEVRAPGYFTVTRTVTIETEKPTRETVVMRKEQTTGPDPSGPGPGPAASGAGAGGPAVAASRASAETPGSPASTLATNPEEPAGFRSSKSSESDAGAGTDRAGVGWRRPTEIAVAGVAAVGLVLGIVEHVKWRDKVGSFERMDSCGVNELNHGGAACQQLYSDGQRARNLAFIGYGAAATLTATALILYLTEPAAGTNTSMMTCAPTSGARGLQCALRF